MIATPLVIILYDRLIRPRFIDCVAPPEQEQIESRDDSVIVAGYGRFGQVVSRLLTASGFHTTLLDHDAGQIEMTGRFGYKVFYGDASRQDLLQAAGADKARNDLGWRPQFGLDEILRTAWEWSLSRRALEQ